MENNELTFHISGRYYAIDMEAYMAFISKSPSQEKSVSTNINQYYDKGFVDEDKDVISKKKGEPLEVQTKEINETKTNINETFVNIRYDFIRQLLTTIISPVYDANGELKEDFTYGQALALSTLLREGIIVEVNED